MILEEGLHAHLIANAPLAASVGTRIYPMRLPEQFTAPAVTYQRILTNRPHSHDETTSGVANPRLQIDVWSFDYLSAKNTNTLVKNALKGFKGAFTVGAENIRIDGVLLAGERDFIQPEQDLYRISSEYSLWYGE